MGGEFNMKLVRAIPVKNLYSRVSQVAHYPSFLDISSVKQPEHPPRELGRNRPPEGKP
jgi:ribosome-associated toxin RatA of RatAB toxin-antitoxin module